MNSIHLSNHPTNYQSIQPDPTALVHQHTLSCPAETGMFCFSEASTFVWSASRKQTGKMGVDELWTSSRRRARIPMSHVCGCITTIRKNPWPPARPWLGRLCKCPNLPGGHEMFGGLLIEATHRYGGNRNLLRGTSNLSPSVFLDQAPGLLTDLTDVSHSQGSGKGG